MPSRVIHTAQALVDVILEVDALPARKIADLPGPSKIREAILGKLEGNEIGQLLAEYELIPAAGSKRTIRNDAIDLNGSIGDHAPAQAPTGEHPGSKELD